LGGGHLRSNGAESLAFSLQISAAPLDCGADVVDGIQERLRGGGIMQMHSSQSPLTVLSHGVMTFLNWTGERGRDSEGPKDILSPIPGGSRARRPKGGQRLDPLVLAPPPLESSLGFQGWPVWTQPTPLRVGLAFGKQS